jgi:nucleoside-diphosphate-sugar epimerase
MVIGNGLIANNMSYFINKEDFLIFASGVSNSKETDRSKYEREIDLIKTFIKTKKKFIYFSTCSVLYDCIEKTDYIEHKKKIESLIKNNFQNYIIFRLPNVVGLAKNEYTSFNFFLKKLKKNDIIKIEKYTTRYFIDIIDVVDTITPIILNKEINKKIINVCFNNKISILNFINVMSEHYKIEPKISIEDKGCDFDVDNRYFIELIDKKYKLINFDYNINLIKKYC